jgi:hypothetical protein
MLAVTVAHSEVVSNKSATFTARKAQNSVLESLLRRYHLEDIGLGGMILLKWNLMICYEGVWTELIWLRIGFDGGCYVHRNRPSGLQN